MYHKPTKPDPIVSPATWDRRFTRQELFTSLWEIVWLALGIACFAALCTALTS